MFVVDLDTCNRVGGRQPNTATPSPAVTGISIPPSAAQLLAQWVCSAGNDNDVSFVASRQVSQQGRAMK